MSAAPLRSERPKELLWDVESVYATPELWEADFKRIPEAIAPFATLKGALTSAAAVAALFKAEDDLGLLLDRLRLYAHMKEDEDTSVGENQSRMARFRAQSAKISGELAWTRPELLMQSAETLQAWAKSPELRAYQRSIELLLREKPHVLSTEEETLLGLAGDVFGTAYDAFSKLTNADLKFRDATDAAGKPHSVTNGTISSLLQNKDRVLRESAFGALYQGYGDHINALASLLAGSTKSHTFNAQVRKFPNALDASLFSDNIPRTVYKSLIAAVRQALPIFHDYVALRAKHLKISDMNMWDFLVPIVPQFELKVSWEKNRDWVTESCKPLGDEYMEGVRASFSERWYDVYENKGKRSGAYSTGAYGQKPFMLLNYHGTLNDVFTTAHELGHSMHSLMSQRHQPYRTSDYPIFLAEIASTTNEALLHHHILETQSDKQLRAYLLNHLCDSFRGTMFRQVMFAEFELEIHERLERGEAMTADSLKEYYYDLNAAYYGPNVKADPRIMIEWSRIPHFYYNFYVYKYATGFAAAQIFSQRILKGSAERDMYLGFLKSGSSQDPLDTVAKAGVNLADPAVLQQAFAGYKKAINDLDRAL